MGVVLLASVLVCCAHMLQALRNCLSPVVVPEHNDGVVK